MGSTTRTSPLLHVLEELVAKHPDTRRDRRRYGGTEDTDRRLLRRPADPGCQVVADVHEQIEVGLAARSGLQAQEDVLEPARTLSAWCALTARLRGGRTW